MTSEGSCDLTLHCFCGQLSHYFPCSRFQAQHATCCSINTSSLHCCVFSPDTPWWASLTSFTFLLRSHSHVSLVAALFLLILPLVTQANSHWQKWIGKLVWSQTMSANMPNGHSTLSVFFWTYVTQTNLSFLMCFPEPAFKDTRGFPVALQASVSLLMLSSPRFHGDRASCVLIYTFFLGRTASVTA